MPRLAFAAVYLVLIVGHSGCDHYVNNPLSCEHPDNASMCPDAHTMGDSCSHDSDCKDSKFPFCELTSTHCVQCIQREQCSGTTPVCSSNVCIGCTKHTDCDSNACLSDGSCAAEAQVAYVDPTVPDSSDCTKNAPCIKVMKALGLPNRLYVKLLKNVNEAVTVDGQSVTLLADPGVTLMRNTDNAVILQVKGISTVEIDDLQIVGTQGRNNIGLSVPVGSNVTLLLKHVKISGNENVGIIFSSPGSLTISRSEIHDNQGGGISVGITPITFDITNNFIYRNGSSNALVGGAALNPLIGGTSGTSRFEFNTVVDNQIQDSASFSGGVFCDKSGFTAVNNIIARNLVNGNASRTSSNTAGLCGHQTSAISPTVTSLKFTSPDNSPYDYHIAADSSAVGQALTPSTVTVDFDNEPRPANASDQGADQHKP